MENKKTKLELLVSLLKSKKFLIITFLFASLIGILVLKSASNRQNQYTKLSFENKKGSVGRWQENLRKKIANLTGARLPSQSIPTADDLWRGEKEEKNSYYQQKLQLLFNQDKKVFCYLLEPKSTDDTTLPAVIFSPGNGTGLIELLEDPESAEFYYQNRAAKFLAENGFIVLTCEPWAFWSSSESPNQRDIVMNEYLLKGKALMGIYIDQIRSEISWLVMQENVNPEKIGLAGVSFGGAVSFYTAALDERATANFVSGFLTSFETTYFNYLLSPEMIIPGLYQWADIPDIAGLIAPRWLMFDNGEDNDSLAMRPEKAARLISEEIKPIFKEFNAEDKLLLNQGDQGHVLDREAALEFFNLTLK